MPVKARQHVNMSKTLHRTDTNNHIQTHSSIATTPHTDISTPPASSKAPFTDAFLMSVLVCPIYNSLKNQDFNYKINRTEERTGLEWKLTKWT